MSGCSAADALVLVFALCLIFLGSYSREGFSYHVLASTAATVVISAVCTFVLTARFLARRSAAARPPPPSMSGPDAANELPTAWRDATALGSDHYYSGGLQGGATLSVPNTAAEALTEVRSLVLPHLSTLEWIECDGRLGKCSSWLRRPGSSTNRAACFAEVVVQGGMASGHGSLLWRKGTETVQLYSGQWAFGRRHGAGRAVLFGKHKGGGVEVIGVYEGEWLAGVRHGQGTMRSQNGVTYVGDFEYDYKQGEGVETLPCGTSYKVRSIQPCTLGCTFSEKPSPAVSVISHCYLQGWWYRNVRVHTGISSCGVTGLRERREHAMDGAVVSTRLLEPDDGSGAELAQIRSKNLKLEDQLQSMERTSSSAREAFCVLCEDALREVVFLPW